MKDLKEATIIFICVTILILSAIIGVAIYSISDRSLMAQNIESAIAKGIDPMSVRCSYVHSQDLICVAFASSEQSHASSVVKK